MVKKLDAIKIYQIAESGNTDGVSWGDCLRTRSRQYCVVNVNVRYQKFYATALQFVERGVGRGKRAADAAAAWKTQKE